jgi:hypothetical protein
VHRIDGAWIDDAGIVLLTTDVGVGMIDDSNLDRLLSCFFDASGATLTEEAIAHAIEQLQSGNSAELFLRFRDSTVPVTAIAAADVPAKFGFVPRPVQPAGEEECY